MNGTVLGLLIVIVAGLFSIIGLLAWIAYRLGGVVKIVVRLEKYYDSISKTLSLLEMSCPLLKGSKPQNEKEQE